MPLGRSGPGWASPVRDPVDRGSESLLPESLLISHSLLSPATYLMRDFGKKPFRGQVS